MASTSPMTARVAVLRQVTETWVGSGGEVVRVTPKLYTFHRLVASQTCAPPGPLIERDSEKYD